jgi:predicted DNA-binding transcriptional regulator AlpA
MAVVSSEREPHRQHRILGYDDLKSKGIKFSRQWISVLIKQGRFPKAVRMGEASAGFIEAEIDAWIEGLIDARDAS